MPLLQEHFIKSPKKKISPIHLGYRMPAEWEPHTATWLTWPQNKTTWPGKLLKEVESIYLQMIAALLPGEKVNLLVKDRKTADFISRSLASKRANTGNLVFHPVKTVDTWIRDYGPIFVKKNSHDSRLPPIMRRRIRPLADTTHDKVAFTKWKFNAWGGKYSDLARDNGVVDRVDALKKYHRFDTGIVLEGGSIDMNGRGTCLTTEQCLLNNRRNSGFSRSRIEKFLEQYLGVTKVLWLKEGIEGDDTDGHVDDITRFINPTTILTAMESDPRDKNHTILEENRQILKSFSDQDGRHFRIVELPMPGRVGVGRLPAGQAGGDTSSDRLPASYANFYIANRTVLLPIYSHRNDKTALKILKDVFPGRKIVPIECTALVYGLGSIHCVTQQEPK